MKRFFLPHQTLSCAPAYYGLPAIFLVAVVLFSCADNTIYDEYVAIEENNWKKEDIAKFEFSIEDTVSAHNFYINIRNNGKYAYSNLYLFVTIVGPNGEAISDTLNCILADKRGKWVGKGTGNLWHASIPYINNFRFAHHGAYKVSYEQAMRAENGLTGIADVGLKIEKRSN